MHHASGAQQSPGSSSGEDGDAPTGRRRKKNVCEDTRFLWDHIKGLTNSISGHMENGSQRSASTGGQVDNEVNESVRDGDVRRSNGKAEIQGLAYLETRVKAIDLLKRSYAQVVDADRETGDRDGPVYVRTKKTYDKISQEFERTFGFV